MNWKSISVPSNRRCAWKYRAAEPGDTPMVLLAKYPVCAFSGTIGPKRCQGDSQVPEGFYSIDRFNPWSNFYLSLGINYPNFADRILKTCNDPGGLYSSMVHASLSAVFLLLIFGSGNYTFIAWKQKTADRKRSRFIFSLRAWTRSITVVCREFIFSRKKWLELWEDLKTAYDLFENKHTPPQIRFLPSGRHKIK